MASNREQIKGIPLQDKPAEVSQCGMSHATFAQHRATKEWFELSDQGQVLGTALDLDYYRQDVQPRLRTQSKQEAQELSQVSVR